MNRSILIVICDFLLVSLLVFSDFEKMENPGSASPSEAELSVQESSGKQDMVGALKLALDDERRNREQLATELARSQQSIQSQQSLLAERETRIQQFQDDLKRTESQAEQLDQQRNALQQQIASSKSNLESLQTALTATKSEANLSREQLQALQNDLLKRQQEAETLKNQLSQLEKNHTAAIVEKQQLNTKLQVAEAEKRLTVDQLNTMRSEVQTVRAEKAQLQANTAKLAEGVTALAEKSTALTQEIRDNRPLTPNTIFSEFSQNRVEVHFESVRSGTFGQGVKKEKNTQTVLVADGSQVYALFHVGDTTLSFWPPGTEWQSLSGIIARSLFSFPLTNVAFLAQDPRIVAIPLSATQARQLGTKIYKIAPDPYKFQEAVLIGANEGYYGECKFQIDLSTPQYVRMDRSLFRGLLGKFNPTRGDLVLSKTGEVLGIMANNDYCAVLGKITPSHSLLCGDDLKTQQAAQLLAQFHNRVIGLPVKLQ